VATLVLVAIYGVRETQYALKALLVDKHLIVLGVVGIGLTFAFYIASLRYLEATAAAVLVFLAPFLTAFLARLVIREPVGWHLPIAALVMLVGSYFAVSHGSLGALIGAGFALGVTLNLLSVVFWSVYTVHLRVVAPRYPARRLLIATFTAASVFFLGGALVFDGAPNPLEGAFASAALMHLGLFVVFPGLLAYLFYALAIGRTGAGPVSLLLGIELIVASVLAHLLLNELFPPQRLMGLLLVILAVSWFVWKQNRFARRMQLAASLVERRDGLGRSAGLLVRRRLALYEHAVDAVS
jgi:drug/metabolite transporter (DMT)-like permease